MRIIKMISQFSMFRVFIFAALITGAYFFMYYDNGAIYETQILQIKSEIATEEIKKKETEKTIKREDVCAPTWLHWREIYKL